jgi:hypothetical protein
MEWIITRPHWIYVIIYRDFEMTCDCKLCVGYVKYHQPILCYNYVFFIVIDVANVEHFANIEHNMSMHFNHT